MRSALAAKMGRSPTTEDELVSMASAAFHQRGVITIFPHQIKGWAEREYLTRVAEREYGTRKPQEPSAGMDGRGQSDIVLSEPRTGK